MRGIGRLERIIGLCRCRRMRAPLLRYLIQKVQNNARMRPLQEKKSVNKLHRGRVKSSGGQTLLLGSLGFRGLGCSRDRSAKAGPPEMDLGRCCRGVGPLLGGFRLLLPEKEPSSKEPPGSAITRGPCMGLSPKRTAGMNDKGTLIVLSNHWPNPTVPQVTSAEWGFREHVMETKSRVSALRWANQCGPRRIPEQDVPNDSPNTPIIAGRPTPPSGSQLPPFCKNCSFCGSTRQKSHLAAATSASSSVIS
jgi:hypothetical protein